LKKFKKRRAKDEKNIYNKKNVNCFYDSVLYSYYALLTFYDTNSSSVIDEITGIHYFDSFPAAAKPQRTGCIFKGYYTLPNGEVYMYYTEDIRARE